MGTWLRICSRYDTLLVMKLDISWRNEMIVRKVDMHTLWKKGHQQEFQFLLLILHIILNESSICFLPVFCQVPSIHSMHRPACMHIFMFCCNKSLFMKNSIISYCIIRTRIIKWSKKSAHSICVCTTPRNTNHIIQKPTWLEEFEPLTLWWRVSSSKLSLWELSLLWIFSICRRNFDIPWRSEKCNSKFVLLGLFSRIV